jgi:hypothetical protein
MSRVLGELAGQIVSGLPLLHFQNFFIATVVVGMAVVEVEGVSVVV